jgi:energy-coupling factor transporter ATP-binding protein EcfA2
MGENASGKTTLARLMCGLLAPSKGQVLVDGLDTADPESVYEVRRRVGLVFQDPDDQLVEMTVEREIGFGLRNLGLDPSEVAARVDGAVSLFGLGHLRKRSCHLLSAGEKQTVTVASIFVMQPDYVILDESTSLLDSESRARLVGAVERLLGETGAGLVFISMRLEDVWACNRTVFLQGGTVGFEGSKEDLLAYLRDRGLPLSGLASMASRVGGIFSGFGSRIAECTDFSAECLGEAFGRLGEDIKGGGACP